MDMDMDISTMISVHYIRGLLLRRCYLSPFSTSLFSWTSRSAYYLDIPLIRITPHHCEYLHFHVSFTLVNVSQFSSTFRSFLNCSPCSGFVSTSAVISEVGLYFTVVGKGIDAVMLSCNQ